MYQTVRQRPVGHAPTGTGSLTSTGSPSARRLSAGQSRPLYKPPAARLLSPTLFFAIFGACIGLIEWVISDTVIDDTSLAATTAAASAQKRYLTTITTYDTSQIDCATYTTPSDCPARLAYSSSFTAAESIYSSLCIAYSNSFQSYTALSLPTSLQVPFTAWTSAYSSQQTLRSNIETISITCLQSPDEACSSDWWNYLNSTSLKTTTVTIGCQRSIMKIQPPCMASGGLSLNNGTITSTAAVNCGVKHLSQLIITSDVTSTSQISTKLDNAKAVILDSPASTDSSAQQTATISTAPQTPTQITTSSSSASLTPSLRPVTNSQLTTAISTMIIEVTTKRVISNSSVSANISATHLSYSIQGGSASETLSPAFDRSSEWTSTGPLDNTLYPSIANGSTLLTSSSQFVQSEGLGSLTGPGSIHTTSSASNIQTNESVGSATISSMNSDSTSPASTDVSNKTQTVTAGDSSIAFSLAAHEVIVERTFTYASYFAAMFLPALIAVIVKIRWDVIGASLKLVEPFQRLTGSRGVAASDSILTLYLESMVSLDVLRTIGRGHVVPIFSAAIYIMVEVAPLVASVSMNVKARDMCVIDQVYMPCNPAWIINISLIRTLEGFMAVCMALTLCLMWFTRKSHIPTSFNPSSIAALAALLNYDPLVRDLQRIDPDADGRVFSAALNDQLFRLEEHQDSKLDIIRFGFVTCRAGQVEGGNEGTNRSSFWGSGKTPLASYTPVDGGSRPNQRRQEISWNQLRRRAPLTWTLASLHLLTTTCLLAFLVAYPLDQNLDDAFNRFFNGDSVPQIVPKTILVGLAVIVNVQMKYLDRTVRITEPFRRLALRNARPETTILLPLNGTCWSNLPKNLYLLCRYEFAQGRMAWATFVGFVGCVSDANIVAIAGVLWTPAQTPQAYEACYNLSVACTSTILLVVLVTMIWWLNVSVVRRMPRLPDTIGGMLSYLCGSEMVRDWNRLNSADVPMENLSADEMDAVVLRSGRRFCFARMLGVDGRERWCIDYEGHQPRVMVAGDVETIHVASAPSMPKSWQVSAGRGGTERRTELGWEATPMNRGMEY